MAANEATTSPPPEGQDEELICLEVKWRTHSMQFQFSPSYTIEDVKGILYERTNVLPMRQKLLGLNLNGRPAPDDKQLAELNIKTKQKIMMVGTPEAEIPIAPDDMPEVIVDFDIETKDLDLDVRLRPENRKKLQHRIETTEIRIINPPRDGKKLLVLDLDYTLFDCKGNADTIAQLKRPGLDDFLAACYTEYDIVIWSQTSWKWLEMKITELGMLTSEAFHICFVLDRTSMFSVESKHRTHEVKPLELIWAKFTDRWNAKNTVHVDDLSRNFAMNPKNGLKIAAFKNARVMGQTDRELLYLGQYLLMVAKANENLGEVDHSRWKAYVLERGGRLS
eukprot:tig00021179_g19282.t1